MQCLKSSLCLCVFRGLACEGCKVAATPFRELLVIILLLRWLTSDFTLTLLVASCQAEPSVLWGLCEFGIYIRRMLAWREAGSRWINYMVPFRSTLSTDELRSWFQCGYSPLHMHGFLCRGFEALETKRLLAYELQSMLWLVGPY